MALLLNKKSSKRVFDALATVTLSMLESYKQNYILIKHAICYHTNLITIYKVWLYT